MNQSNFCPLPSPMLPMSPDEPLWEWDIVSDHLFPSQGAIRILNLSRAPAKMEDFYKLLPPYAAQELARMREGALSGKNSSTIECDYICNVLWIRELKKVFSDGMRLFPDCWAITRPCPLR